MESSSQQPHACCAALDALPRRPWLPSRLPSSHTSWSGRGSGRQGGARHCTNDLDALGRDCSALPGTTAGGMAAPHLHHELPAVAVRVSAIPESERPRRRHCLYLVGWQSAQPPLSRPGPVFPPPCGRGRRPARPAGGADMEAGRAGRRPAPPRCARPLLSLREDCLADPERPGATSQRRAQRVALI